MMTLKSNKIILTILLLTSLIMLFSCENSHSNPKVFYWQAYGFFQQEKLVSQEDVTVVQEKKITLGEAVDYAWVPNERTVSILSVGDIMAHSIQLEAAKTPDGYDFNDQFKWISEIIKSRDFAIGNLETVFDGPESGYSGRNMIFNTPDALGVAIKNAGFDILTTANNHSLDRGYSGLSRTIEVLDDLDIMHAGTARTKEASETLLMFEKEEMTFALLSYSFSSNGWPIPKDHPYALNMIDDEKIVSDIKKAKEKGADFVLVAPHWGLEYHLNENIHQRRLTEKMFYAGADIVLGTHPHVIQPFEHQVIEDASGILKDKFIIYSQGNFVSGQRTYPRAIGMHITFKFTKFDIETPFVSEVSVMPTFVESTYKNGQRFMRILDTNKGYEMYLKDELDISNELANQLKEYEKDFLKHIVSRTNFEPYLNEEKAYVIYEKKGSGE
jgi:poly-gamma-glutamate synthesis protein (capsule biosynthesis protein)